MEDFEYLELWYLTQEGCADTAQNLCTINKDSFGISKVDDIMSLKSILSIWASKNVVQDIDLTWQQMSIAKTTLIKQIARFHWPQKNIGILAKFFMNLEVYHYCQYLFGEQALLIYQAHVCWD